MPTLIPPHEPLFSKRQSNQLGDRDKTTRSTTLRARRSSVLLGAPGSDTGARGVLAWSARLRAWPAEQFAWTPRLGNSNARLQNSRARLPPLDFHAPGLAREALSLMRQALNLARHPSNLAHEAPTLARRARTHERRPLTPAAGQSQSEGRNGGESGIRTHGRFDPSAVFKTAALNHSAISPYRRCRLAPVPHCAAIANRESPDAAGP